jgi:hypothetical protein
MSDLTPNLTPNLNGEQTISKRSLVIALAITFIVFVVGIAAYTIHSNNVKAEKEAIRAELALKAYEAELEAERIRNDVSWVPDGYYSWDDDKSIAWKWIDDAGSDCYECTYWTVEVISKNGCFDGIYSEINIEEYDVVVGYTNDTLNYLGPFQTGRLTFESYIDGNLTGNLTELNCR